MPSLDGSVIRWKNKQIISNMIVTDGEQIEMFCILLLKLARAVSAAAAEYHDTTLGGVTDGSTKFNVTFKKLRWASV